MRFTYSNYSRKMSPPPLASQASLALCKKGRTQADFCIALTESDDEAVAVHALDAVARSGYPNALPVLLSTLNPDLDRMIIRSGLQAIETLNDPRAIRPLVRFLEAAPDYLRLNTVRTLRKVAKSRIGQSPTAWKRWIDTTTLQLHRSHTPTGQLNKGPWYTRTLEVLGSGTYLGVTTLPSFEALVDSLPLLVGMNWHPIVNPRNDSWIVVENVMGTRCYFFEDMLMSAAAKLHREIDVSNVVIARHPRFRTKT